MTKTYNEIGASYRGLAENARDRKYLFNYTVEQAIAAQFGSTDLKDKVVFDAGTGGGCWARRFAELGAARVLAVDSAKHELEAARAATSSKVIEYRHLDLGEAPTLFDKLYAGLDADLAFAGLVLHYARNYQQLLGMCEHVAMRMKSGGIFMALVANPDDPTFQEAERYRCETVRCTERGMDSNMYRVTLYDWLGEASPESFVITHHNRNVYKSALSPAGFNRIAWHKLSVDPAHADDPVPGFWNGYIEKSPIMLLTCRRR